MTLFELGDGVDDGPIYGQKRIAVGPRTTVGELVIAAEAAALELVGECLPGIAQGTLRPHAQSGTPSYGLQRAPEDGRLEWWRTAIELDRLVRAVGKPYPGAFAELAGGANHDLALGFPHDTVGMGCARPDRPHSGGIGSRGRDRRRAACHPEATAASGDDAVTGLRRAVNQRLRACLMTSRMSRDHPWILVDAALVAIAVLVLARLYRWVQDRGILSRRFALEGDEGDAMTHLVAGRSRAAATGTDSARHGAVPVLHGLRLSGVVPQASILHAAPFAGARRVAHQPGLRGRDTRQWLSRRLVHLHADRPRRGLARPRPARRGWMGVHAAAYANPRRGSVLGERCFGYIFGHSFLFCVAMLSASTGQFLWIVPAVLAFTVGAASSKFTLQAMTFVALAFAAIRFDPFRSSLLVHLRRIRHSLSAGYVIRVAAGTVNHSRLYVAFWFGFMTIRGRSRRRTCGARPFWPSRGRLRDARASFRRHPIHRLPSLVPWLLTFVRFPCIRAARR